MGIEDHYRESAYRHYKLSPAERLAATADRHLPSGRARRIALAAAMATSLVLLLWTASRLPQAQELRGVCRPGRIVVDVGVGVSSLTLLNQPDSSIAVQRDADNIGYLANSGPALDLCRGRSSGDQIKIKAVTR